MNAIDRWIALYVRVSTTAQSEAAQLPDLEAWAAACGRPVRWYRDKFTGTTMARPGMDTLLTDVRCGRVEKIVIWRIDRLGRLTSGLAALFDELLAAGVPLLSLREGFDLSTPAGRFMAHMLASMAQYETEVRGERVRAGQARARANGKRWGGSKPRQILRVDEERRQAVLELHEQGHAIAKIARLVKVSRPTIYALLQDEGRGTPPPTSRGSQGTSGG